MRAKSSRFVAIFVLMASACTTAPKAPAPDVSAPAVPAEPVYQRGDIMGAAPDALDALLGAPDLTRREGVGEFRRYTLNTCSLIVILYPDDNGARRAAHIESASLIAGEENPEIEDCLAAG